MTDDCDTYRLIGTILSLGIIGAALAARFPAIEVPAPRRVEGYYKGQITPHWFAENKCFWYRNDLSGGAKEFILVNAEQGTRQPAFDHAKLAAALSQAAGAEYKADRLPFDAIEFAEGGKVRPIRGGSDHLGLRPRVIRVCEEQTQR